MAQLVSRHSCVADRLPVVVRFPAGPRVSLKWWPAERQRAPTKKKKLFTRNSQLAEHQDDCQSTLERTLRGGRLSRIFVFTRYVSPSFHPRLFTRPAYRYGRRYPRGWVGMAALLYRSQTAGGGSIPRWSVSKPQVVTRRKARGADQKRKAYRCGRCAFGACHACKASQCDLRDPGWEDPGFRHCDFFALAPYGLSWWCFWLFLVCFPTDGLPSTWHISCHVTLLFTAVRPWCSHSTDCFLVVLFVVFVLRVVFCVLLVVAGFGCWLVGVLYISGTTSHDFLGIRTQEAQYGISFFAWIRTTSKHLYDLAKAIRRWSKKKAHHPSHACRPAVCFLLHIVDRMNLNLDCPRSWRKSAIKAYPKHHRELSSGLETTPYLRICSQTCHWLMTMGSSTNIEAVADGPSRAVGNLRIRTRRSVVLRLLHLSKLCPGLCIWRVEPALYSGGWFVLQGTSRCKCWCAPWVGRRAAIIVVRKARPGHWRWCELG